MRRRALRRHPPDWAAIAVMIVAFGVGAFVIIEVVLMTQHYSARP
jgi:hypothetical protein